jgi:hypothetical protein
MFLLLAKFKFLKLEKSDFGGCQLPKVAKRKREKNRQIPILGFHCVA